MNKALEKITAEICYKLLGGGIDSTLNGIPVKDFIRLAFIAGAKAHRDSTRIDWKNGDIDFIKFEQREKSRIFFKDLI